MSHGSRGEARPVRPAWMLFGPAVVAAVVASPGCARDGGTVPLVRPAAESRPADLVEQVRARLLSLQRGMSEKAVDLALADLPLGAGEITSRTISGGKEVEYELPGGHHLRLLYIPRGYGPGYNDSANQLYSASLTD